MHDARSPDEGRFVVPRWAWRGLGGTTAVVLLAVGEPVGALGAVVAFATAEVVFDAAALEARRRER